MKFTITEVTPEQFKEIITESAAVEPVRGEGVGNYHGRMMNIAAKTPPDSHHSAYQNGVSAAREAAAWIAIEADARISELEARFEAIEDALEDAGAPGATEAKALDNDPIIERIKLWAIAQDSPSELKARADEAERERNVAVFQFNNWKGRAIEAEKERDEAKHNANVVAGAMRNLVKEREQAYKDIDMARQYAEQAEAQLTEHKNKYLHTAEDMELLAATLNKSRADIATQRDEAIARAEAAEKRLVAFRNDIAASPFQY